MVNKPIENNNKMREKQLLIQKEITDIPIYELRPKDHPKTENIKIGEEQKKRNDIKKEKSTIDKEQIIIYKIYQ